MASSATSTSPPLSLAALSIYQIIRLYCGEKLLFDPIYWTSRHVSLLQCHFEDPTLAPSAPQSQPDSTDGKSEKNAIEKLAGYVKRLRFGSQSWLRDTGICGILADSESPLTFCRDDLKFYFEQKPIRILPCIVFKIKDSSNELAKSQDLPPVVAFIDYSDIECLRIDVFNKRYPNRYNIPVYSMLDLQLKKITPPEPLRDPYIVAVLIGLAQQQQCFTQLSKQEESANAFLSQVLVSHDKKDLHLFTANISLSFLRKLDYPTIPPPDSAPPSVSIRHTIIPYKPFRTFKQRLRHLILTFDNNNNNNN